MLPSWTLTSWPSVRWCAADDPRTWPAFQHMGTDVRAGGDEQGRPMGDTLWAARLADGNLLGLAWEWVQVSAGLVVLRDPNGIISNAWLEDESGEQLPELRALCVINGMAHATPWQQTVCRCLGVAQPPAGARAAQGAATAATAAAPCPPAPTAGGAAGGATSGWPGSRALLQRRAAGRHDPGG
jgi:hypothetical protein